MPEFAEQISFRFVSARVLQGIPTVIIAFALGFNIAYITQAVAKHRRPAKSHDNKRRSKPDRTAFIEGEITMRIFRTLLLAVCFASVLAGCGSENGSPGASVSTSTARGTLIENPPLRIASLNAADFTAQLNASPSGQQLLQIASSGTMSLPCGVDFHYIQYATVGGAGETTTASARADGADRSVARNAPERGRSCSTRTAPSTDREASTSRRSATPRMPPTA